MIHIPQGGLYREVLNLETSVPIPFWLGGMAYYYCINATKRAPRISAQPPLLPLGA